METEKVTKSEYVTLRLPSMLVQKLNQEAESRGMRRGAFLRAVLISQFLNLKKSEDKEEGSDEK